MRLRPFRNDDGTYSFNTEMYDKNDGLQYSDFNLRSICKLPDGTIVAGGILGVNMFNPKDMKFNSHTPKVMFTGFTLFNEEVLEGQTFHGLTILPQSLATTEEIVLSANQNIFSISFGTDNYILPEKKPCSPINWRASAANGSPCPPARTPCRSPTWPPAATCCT